MSGEFAIGLIIVGLLALVAVCVSDSAIQTMRGRK